MTLPVASNDTSCHCPLLETKQGSESTVVAIACGESEACRLRALGLYEGATVSVIGKRHCLLVDVSGTRLALGSDLATGITVQPRAASAP